MATDPTPVPPTPNFGNKVLSELPALLVLAESADTAYKAIPHPAKAVDYGKAAGFLPNSLSMTMLGAYDDLKGGAHVTVEEVANVLGVDPKGVFGQALSIGEALAS